MSDWMSVAVRGCPWLSVAVRGCPWLPWRPWLSVAVRGCRAMPDAEKPRVAKAAPAGRSASLSKRQWQDIRRARKLGADGLGGGLRVHGVEIFFPRPLKDVIHTATNGGQNGQRGGERRDDSQHTASRPDSRRQTGATPTRNARQQRQHDRLLAFKKATRHRLSSIFRAWAEAARATEEGGLQPSHAVR